MVNNIQNNNYNTNLLFAIADEIKKERDRHLLRILMKSACEQIDEDFDTLCKLYNDDLNLVSKVIDSYQGQKMLEKLINENSKIINELNKNFLKEFKEFDKKLSTNLEDKNKINNVNTKENIKLNQVVVHQD